MRIRVLLPLPLAAAAAVPASLLTQKLIGGDPGAPSPTAATLERLESLSADVDRLNEDLDEEETRLEALGLAPLSPGPQSGTDDEEIAEAVERWLARQVPGPESEKAIATGHPAAEFGVREMELELIVSIFLDRGRDELSKERFLQEVRDEGRIDELVRAIEDMADENPDDPDLQVALGVAYLHKLFGLGQTPEVGLYAMQADLAFDRALALDEHNWDARFTKAVALSNWPPVMGKVPEAVAHFEILIRQQEQLPPDPRYAETYLYLGNMYEQIGEKEKALATWRAGLSSYPEFEGLAERIAAAEG